MFSKESYKYTMGGFIKNVAWVDHKWIIKGVQEDAIRLIDLHESSANIHRKADGAVLKSELLIIDEMTEVAEEFLNRLKIKRKEYKKRLRKYKKSTLYPEIVCLKNIHCPEIVLQKTMSYLSPIVRLENLRQKYTDEYIISGLSKKKLPQLKLIYTNYYQALLGHFDKIKNPEVATIWEETQNDQFHHILETLSHFWKFETRKKQKINLIFCIYYNAEQALYHNFIDWSDYNSHCQGVIKLLHMLVLAIRPCNLE